MNNQELIDHIYEISYEMLKLIKDRKHMIVFSNVKTTNKIITISFTLAQTTNKITPYFIEKHILEKFLPYWKKVHYFNSLKEQEECLANNWFHYKLKFEHINYNDVDFQAGSIYSSFTQMDHKAFLLWVEKHHPNIGRDGFFL